MILLLVFFFLFFLQVVTQYSEKLTNTATTTKKSELVEAPTFSICTYWRDSIMKRYNITLMILSIPPDNDTNLPLNSTLTSLFNEITFQLNKNFFIGVSSDLSKPIPLSIGMNEMKGEEENFESKSWIWNVLCSIYLSELTWYWTVFAAKSEDFVNFSNFLLEKLISGQFLFNGHKGTIYSNSERPVQFLKKNAF